MGMLGLSQGPFRPTLLPPGLVELTKISDDLILSESDFQLNWAQDFQFEEFRWDGSFLHR